MRNTIEINQKRNILGLFVKIIDANKCYFDLNLNSDTNFLWPNQFIRNKAGISEWKKYNYTPTNGDVGEVVANLNGANFTEPVYIIRTYGLFYVPINLSGFEVIIVKQSNN